MSANHAITAGVIGLALGGAWVSGALLVGHDGGWQAEQTGMRYLLRVCDSHVFQSASCAEVVASRWGAVDFVIGSHRVVLPTSLIGLAYFLAAAIWFIMVGPIDSRQRWLWRFTLLAMSCGLAASIFFTFNMAYTLSQWCPLCAAAHAFNGGIFGGTVWLWRRTAAQYRDDAPGPVPYDRVSRGDTVLLSALRRKLVCCAVVVAGMAAVGVWMYYQAVTEARSQWRENNGMRQVIAELQSDGDFMLREYYASPVVDVPRRDDGDHSPETQRARVIPMLVVFTDYDQGACACFEARRHSMFDDRFRGDIRIDYRQGPRPAGEFARPDLVDYGTAGEVPHAGLAAAAARMQGDKQAYGRMRDLLFRHRKDRPQRDFAQLARRAGLDVERFLADMSSEDVLQEVQVDLALARELGVAEVPAVFLNGRRVPDLCVQSRTFWRAVAAQLMEDSSIASAGWDIEGR